MTPKTCTECPNHEELASKTNFMYGAGWVAAGVAVLITGVVVGLFQSAFSEAADNRAQIAGVKELVQETNINLQHFMESQGIKYTSGRRE